MHSPGLDHERMDRIGLDIEKSLSGEFHPAAARAEILPERELPAPVQINPGAVVQHEVEHLARNRIGDRMPLETLPVFIDPDPGQYRPEKQRCGDRRAGQILQPPDTPALVQLLVYPADSPFDLGSRSMFIGVLQSPKLFDPKELVPVLLASRHPLLDHTAGLSVTAAVEIIDDFLRADRFHRCRFTE